MRNKFLTYILPIILLLTGVFVADRFLNLNSIEVGEIHNEKQISKIIDKVRSHIVLPENEKPLVATVANVDNLKKSNSFYDNAHNGDYLILFESVKLGILYDKEKDILLKVAPLTLKDTTNQENDSTLEKAAKEIHFDIRNTTNIKGFASQIKDVLSKKELYIVDYVGNSSNKGQSQNYVIVLNKKIPESEYLSISDILDADVLFGLPDGESGSESDIVILLGKEIN